MKTNILKLLLLSFIIIFTCSSSKPEKDDVDKKFKKTSSGLFVGIHEVTNSEFREFTNNLKVKDNINDFRKYYPDTTQWIKVFPNSNKEPWAEKYFWHPGFNNYPVVNVTPEAAAKYCEWLTQKYNSLKKRKFKKVIFRLPTEEEWNQFACVLPGHNLPWYGNFAYNPVSDEQIFPNCCNANVKFENKIPGETEFNYGADGGQCTIAVGSYKPNRIGLYDIIGNVAEITSSGKIKGGSWDNTIDECVVNKTQDFKTPDPRVGFRVVMKIVEY